VRVELRDVAPRRLELLQEDEGVPLRGPQRVFVGRVADERVRAGLEYAVADGEAVSICRRSSASAAG
jgi:hypothetical protein